MDNRRAGSIQPFTWKGCIAIIGGFAVVGVALVCFDRWLTSLQERRQPEDGGKDYRLVALEGSHLVESLYRYKTERGLWPLEKGDLIPGYLSPGELDGWIYEWAPDGSWTLASVAGLP